MNDADGRPDHGRIIRAWWWEAIADRQSSAARGLSARLRRATGVEALAERRVHDLAASLKLRDADRLLRLVRVLAEFRDDDPRPLPRLLGGEDAPMSAARFRRLLIAEGDELATALRRAAPMVGRRCNIARLGADLLWWNDDIRARWTFDYFHTAAPERLARSDPQPEDAA